VLCVIIVSDSIAIACPITIIYYYILFLYCVMVVISYVHYVSIKATQSTQSAVGAGGASTSRTATGPIIYRPSVSKCVVFKAK